MKFKLNRLMLVSVLLVMVAIVYLVTLPNLKQESSPFVFDFEPADIVEVFLSNVDLDEIVLKKISTKWLVKMPVEVMADQDEVESVIRAMASLHQEQELEGALSLADFNLHDGSPLIRVKDNKGKIYSITVGALNPNETMHYVIRSDSDKISLISTEQIKGILKDLNSLQDKRLIRRDLSDVIKVAIQKGSRSVLTLLKLDTSWELKSPLNIRVDTIKVKQLFDIISRLEASRMINDSKSVEGFFEKKALELELTFSDSDKTILTVSDHDQFRDKGYLKIEDSDGNIRYGKIEPDQLATIPTKMELFRDVRLLKSARENLVKIEIQKLGRPKIVLEKVTGSSVDSYYDLDVAWKIVEPIKALANYDEVLSLIHSLGHDGATAIVSEHVDNLQRYGLDLPVLRITVQTDDEIYEVLSVGAIGYQNSQEASYYAIATDLGPVYKISNELFHKINAQLEFLRDRRVFKMGVSKISRVEVNRANQKFLVNNLGDSKFSLDGDYERSLSSSKYNDFIWTILSLEEGGVYVPAPTSTPTVVATIAIYGNADKLLKKIQIYKETDQPESPYYIIDNDDNNYLIDSRFVRDQLVKSLEKLLL